MYLDVFEVILLALLTNSIYIIGLNVYIILFKLKC